MPRSLVRSDWSITSTLMRHSFACICTVTEDYITTVPDSVQKGWMEWLANMYQLYYWCNLFADDLTDDYITTIHDCPERLDGVAGEHMRPAIT